MGGYERERNLNMEVNYRSGRLLREWGMVVSAEDTSGVSDKESMGIR